MNLGLLQILGSITIFIITIVFGIIPLKVPTFRSNPKLLSYSNCFAGGLFLAIGVIHILPEAAESLDNGSDFNIAFLLCIVSFSFILLIDKVIFNSADQVEQSEHIDLSHSFLNRTGKTTYQDNFQEIISSRNKVALRMSQLKNHQHNWETQNLLEEEYHRLSDEEQDQIKEHILDKRDSTSNMEDHSQNDSETEKHEVIREKKQPQDHHHHHDSKKPHPHKDNEHHNQGHHHEHGPDHHGHHHQTVNKGDSALTAYILLLAMGIHSFFGGVALGVARNSSECWNMIIAIVAHKWSEALTVGISFVSAEIDVKQSINYMIFYSFITPLGILLGYLAEKLGDETLVGVFQSISAGTFIYISCGEIIVEEFAISKNKGMKFAFYMGGIVFITLISLMPEK